MTILRDRTTSREDFIFFVDRLATYLIERAVDHLPHTPHTVVTPIDLEYEGSKLGVEVNLHFVLSMSGLTPPPQLCGVSILRS